MAHKKWILRLIINPPGEPPYITYAASDFTLIVTAETEHDAREKADKHDDNGFKDRLGRFGIEHPFLSGEYSTCDVIGF